MKLVEKEEVINGEVNCRVELIRQLIPLGLAAVKDMLEEEVNRLAGDRYMRGVGAYHRWGSNPGSVYLGDQKVSVRVPRVRDLESGKEISLKGYEELKSREHFDEKVFSRVINGLSTRNYEKAAELVPETFGIKKTAVSESFKRATAKRLQEFFERDLSKLDIVSIFIDGKFLRERQVVIALGVTMEGEKIPLGFVETSTENAAVCKDLLNNLIARGLQTEHEILFVIDGAKGIHKAITSVFGNRGVIQRCQWHKRENVVSYLPKSLQDEFRTKLIAAHHEPDYKKAKTRLETIGKELTLINQSAASSLEEGLEETLTIQRLGVFNTVGRSFKTTNCIENLNRQVARYTSRVTKWKNSDQRQRWIAGALLEIEQNFKTVEGFKELPTLRLKMKQLIQNNLKKAA